MNEQNKDIRWKQRFDNYQKAYRLLENALKIESPSDAERAGIIQFFEMAFELAWNLMQDYLKDEGFTLNSPRQTIKQAFQSRIIDNGHLWIEALADRNLTTHTYEEETAMKIENKIRNDYFILLKQLRQFFEDRI